MAQHQVIKAEKIAAVAAVALEEQLVVPALFRREGIDQFRGAKDDTINVKVEGVLPYHSYGWRADRSQPVQFDEYAERTVAIKFGGDIYSAVKLTDEQNEMDLPGWSKLATKQTEAIGRGLEYQACQALETAPFEITFGVVDTALKAGIIKARQALRALRVPGARYIMLIGTNWEAALLNDEKMTLASNVGETQAVTALVNATLARRYGFDFVVASELDPNTAVAMVDSAFIFATGAPSVPASVPFGASASYKGVAIRWIRDYDSLYFQDRSIFNTYKGFRYVDDPLVGTDAVGQSFVSAENHFVRAIKLTLGADANTVQTIGLGAASAGTVAITIGGQTTSAIPYNSTTTTVQAAVQALTSVGSGNCTVSGATFPGVQTFTFAGGLAKANVAQMTAVGTGLTSGVITIATVTKGVGDFLPHGVSGRRAVNSVFTPAFDLELANITGLGSATA
jgi:hypothetical protein